MSDSLAANAGSCRTIQTYNPLLSSLTVPNPTTTHQASSSSLPAPARTLRAGKTTMAALVALPNAARCTPSSRSRVRASWSGGGGSGSGGLSLFDGQRQGVLQAISDRSDTSSGVGARSNGRSTRCVLGTLGRGHNLHREKVGVAPRHRRATGLSAHISPSTSSSTLSADSPIALRRAYDVCAYDDWCLERGIVSPALYIGYVGGGTPDQGETFRGCIATAPVAPGKGILKKGSS